MKFAIQITQSYQSERALTAYNFVKACLEKGHEIHGLFFFQSGVDHGVKLKSIESDVLVNWHTLLQNYHLKPVVCSASAIKHGVEGKNLAEAFAVAGIATWVSFMENADRVIQF